MIMRTLLLLFLTLGSFIAKSQITIDSNHMPTNGDSLRYSIAAMDTAVLMNFQNSGANLNWNFDSLVPQRQGVRLFISSAQTPYSSAVPNRMGEKLADTLSIGGFELYDAYDFFDNSSSEFSLDYRGATAPTGLSFPFPTTLQIAEPFTDPDEVYQFPLDYQDRDSSTFNFTYNNQLVGALYSSSGYRINDVDAWGSLTTPYGTFNCIRVVTDIIGYDTISFANNNIGINSHQREYKWLTPQLNIPALTISGPVTNGVFIPTTIEYRDSVRNVPSVFAPIALFNANPTTIEIGDTVEINNLSISLLPTNYQWDIQPTTFQYINGTSANTDSITVVFNDSGLYDVQLIAINSSGRDTSLIEDYIRVVLPTSIREINRAANDQISLFPNPVSKRENFILETKNDLQIEELIIFDVSGKLVKQERLSISNKRTYISPPNHSGVYFIALKTELGTILKKLIITE